MDDQQGPGEGIRIIGAAEAAPAQSPSPGRAAPAPRTVPVVPPAATWEDADNEAWDDAWLAADGDLEDDAAPHRSDDQTSLWGASEPVAVQLAAATPAVAVVAASGGSGAPAAAPGASSIVSIDDDASPLDGRSSWSTYAARGAAAADDRARSLSDDTDGGDADADDLDDDEFDDDDLDDLDGLDDVEDTDEDFHDADKDLDSDERDDDLEDDPADRDHDDDDEQDDDFGPVDDDLHHALADDDADDLAPSGRTKRRVATRPTAASGPRTRSTRSNVTSPRVPVTGSTAGATSARPRPEGVAKPGGADRTVAAGRAGNRRPVGGVTSESKASNSGSRVLTGVALVAAAAVILKVGGKPGAVALVTIVGLVAVQELFTGLRQRGFLPAILPVLVGVAVLPLAAYKRGSGGILVVLTLAVFVSMLWFLVGPVRDRPVVNIAVSMLGLLYVGFFVSLAGLILHGKHGLGVLVGVIVGAAAHDIAGLFVGKNMGRVPIAPEVSPNKTIEGLLGGVIVAVLASVVYAKFSAPFKGDLSAAVCFAIAVGLLAPLGDLVESMLKRDLGIKDMGTLLPGHGGVLDRVDAMLFVLPGVFLLAKFKGWL